MSPDAEDGDRLSELRKLPAVDRVVAALGDRVPAALAVPSARAVIDELRSTISSGATAPLFDDVLEAVVVHAEDRKRPGLRPVINATGVLVHTNLGRVPLGRRQVEAVIETVSGYSNLEYDLTEGARGSRYVHASEGLAALTGAESALVVNNNAAAVLVTLAALCGGKEVIISRGELIEIGGEFRIPDVMAVSGARLVEVGTTNRTHLSDYEQAITPDTAAILKVHPSNYEVVGFTSSVDGRTLGKLARGRGVTFIHDVGSGLIDAPRDAEWVGGEPIVSSALEDGADVVTFSGDKLLGGPQAGIVVGRLDLIETIQRHPLVRALRVDKMTLAALEATVAAYLTGELDELPLWALASAREDDLRARAEAIADAVRSRVGGGLKIEATATMSLPGGGSLPGTSVPSWGVSVAGGPGADRVHRSLRAGSPPVVGRINDDRLILDLRTVFPEQDEQLQAALLRALGA